MRRPERFEWAIVTVTAAVLAAAMPLQAGYLGWSWDALNHHVYLGLTAEGPRWELDVNPASVQTYQFPYLYWPVYLLSQWPGRPSVAAALWSGFQAAAVALPIWLISYRLLPTLPSRFENLALRVLACASAFMSQFILAGIETTTNDLLACVPLLWAIAISLHPAFDDRRSFAAAALWGMATAFKFSNGLFLPWLLLWWYRSFHPHWPPKRGLMLVAGAALGFGVTYAAWGWQLWQVTGNPFHPFFAAIFARG